MNRISPDFLEIFTIATPPLHLRDAGQGNVPATLHESPSRVAVNGRSDRILFSPYTGTRTASAIFRAVSAFGTDSAPGSIEGRKETITPLCLATSTSTTSPAHSGTAQFSRPCTVQESFFNETLKASGERTSLSP